MLVLPQWILAISTLQYYCVYTNVLLTAYRDVTLLQKELRQREQVEAQMKRAIEEQKQLVIIWLFSANMCMLFNNLVD